MTSPENPRPQMPEGLNIGEALDWLNEYYPVSTSPVQAELATPDPNWYENLVPMQDVQQLTPATFGLVDTEEIKYGWAKYSPYASDNLRVQQRAAWGLVEFTITKDSMKGLWNVYRSLESDGYATKGYQFKPPFGVWDMPKHLRAYEETGDVKGAAQYVAGLLFSPWREH